MRVYIFPTRQYLKITRNDVDERPRQRPRERLDLIRFDGTRARTGSAPPEPSTENHPPGWLPEAEGRVAARGGGDS